MVLAGCANAPTSIKLGHRPNTPVPIRERPPLVFLPVLDERPARNEDSPGQTKLGAWVTTEDSLPGWVEAEARRQFSSRFAVRSAAATPDAGSAVQLVVKDCYAHPVGGNPSVQIILQFRRYVDGRLVEDQAIRGQWVGSIWIRATTEIGTGFRRALENGLAQVCEHLARAQPH
jgi:hypothetical protein